MLHLGISLPCVDIVVLLDSGEKLDERIQKMYRALTESTNKKGGYIVDMNYFRTVTALVEYQIAATKSRNPGKKVYRETIGEIFNQILNIYSIDIDKPIYGTREERLSNNSEIQKMTIPELEKQVQSAASKSEGLVLQNVATGLNEDIEYTLKEDYRRDFDALLGRLIEEAKQTEVRTEGEDVEQAKYNKQGTNLPEYNPANKPMFPQMNEESKIKSYIKMFKTTARLGAFATDAESLRELIDQLKIDPELQENVYDTLLKRGIVVEHVDKREEQKAFIINTMLIPGLEKMVSTNRNAAYSTMKEIIEDDSKYPKDVVGVLNYIKEHLAPNEMEKQKYGEVFTPMSLVNEMLNALPSDVWSDKSLTWLDPANGMGNFPIAVFLRLFYGFRTKDSAYIGITDSGEGIYNPGLTKVIPGDDARRKHIVKNMLFMVELNNKNIAISKKLFTKLAPGIQPNIIQMHRKDGFLADVVMEFPNGVVGEFDIIIGNPPFNRGGINRPDTRKNRKNAAAEGELVKKGEKKETIWNKFVLQSYKKLKSNGFLLFIHPIGWFHPGDYDNIRNIILKNQLHTIKIYKHDSQSVKEFSGSGKISVAYYLMENKNVYTKSNIQGTLGKIEHVRLNEDSIILLNNSSIINKLIIKSPFWKDNKNFKHNSIPCIAGAHKQISGIYESGDIHIVKTSQKHIDADIPKIIISGRNYPRIYRDNGTYGLVGSGVNYWIGTTKELDLLEVFLKTKLAAFLTKELKFRMDFVEFKYFPDITQINISKISDETLAEHFGFTKEEREAINATEYPKRVYTFKEISCTESSKGQKGGADYETIYRQHNRTRKRRRT